MNHWKSWAAGAALVATAAAASGCASASAMLQNRGIGGVFENSSGPHQAVWGGRLGTKKGQSKISAMHILIFGWFNDTDNGIDAARKAGGITRISHVDYHADGLELGLFGYRTITVTVYGD